MNPTSMGFLFIKETLAFLGEFCVASGMKRLWPILFVYSLFGQSSINNEIDSLKIIKTQKEDLINSLKKDIEALQIQISESKKNEFSPYSYNENKLIIKKKSYFDLSLFKKVDTWIVTNGKNRLLDIEEFLNITKSSKEINLLNKRKDFNKKHSILSSLYQSGGLLIMFIPQTGNRALLIGGIPFLYGLHLASILRKEVAKPVISFELARIIVEEYNEDLKNKL